MLLLLRKHGVADSAATVAAVVVMAAVHVLVAVVQVVVHAVAVAPVVLVRARVVRLAGMVDVSRVLHLVVLVTVDCSEQPEVVKRRPHSTQPGETE